MFKRHCCATLFAVGMALGLVVVDSAAAQGDPIGRGIPAPTEAQTGSAVIPDKGPLTPPGTVPADQPAGDTIIVPVGTKLPLVLHNSVTTRNAQPGDPLFFETTFPVVVSDHVVVPAGSFVQGEILEAKRPGRVKGTGEVRVRLTALILPNGYTVKFDAVPTNAGTGGGESTDKEGNIKGDTDKTTDAGTIMKTTGVGAGVGGIAGRSATGAGIGAGIGAAAGIATVLLTRGPELELPRGTSVDIVLDRPLYLDASKVNFSDPGHAPDLAGPANREPTRSRSPL